MIPDHLLGSEALAPLDHARRYAAVGLSVIPVKCDGTKSPAFAGWREYAARRATGAVLAAWFADPARHGVGVVGGAASGNLAVLDVETWAAFRDWGSRLSPVERDALAGSPVVGTPGGGAHVYVRLAESVRGHKLARDPAGKTVIETRGDNHFVVAPGSPAPCHPSGNRWRVIRDGWLGGDPARPLDLETWHALELHAAELNRYSRPAAREVVGDRPGAAAGDRPGDHFNARVGWGDVLGRHGWAVYRSTPGVTYWSRPGKSPAGVSASTGHCTGPGGNSLMYVFSTSAAPFEAETSYSKFAAYALLNHGGDFAAATRALGHAGYGVGRDEWLKRRPKVSVGGKAVRGE